MISVNQRKAQARVSVRLNLAYVLGRLIKNQHALTIASVVITLSVFGLQLSHAQTTAPAVTTTAPAVAATSPAIVLPASAPADLRLETRAKFGAMQLYAKRYEQAISEFKKVLAEAPDHYEARLGLARAYFWTQRVRQAADTLKPLVERGATPEVMQLWNDVAAASGNTLMALKSMDKAIEVSPKDTKPRLSKGILLTSSGCFIPAIKVLSELADKHPANLDIKRSLAHAYFTADRYPESTEIYTGLVDAPSPTGREVRIELARILLKTRHLPEAKEALMELLADDAVDSRPDLGLITVWVFDPKEYLVDADQVLKRLADCKLLANAKSSDSVREWLFMMLGELLAHAAGDTSVQLASGLAQMMEGDKAPDIAIARQSLEQFVKDGPKGVKPDVEPILAGIRDESLQRSGVYRLAELLLAISAGEALVQVCDAYLTVEPEDIAVLLLRAEGLAVMAKYKEARKAYETILDKMPENSKARRGLARNFSWARQFDLCIRVYKELIEQDPTDMVIRREHARALGWDKQLRKSLDAYEDAVKVLGDDSAGRKWRQLLIDERQAKHDYWWGYDRKAAKDYSGIVADEPADLEARFDLAQVYVSNRHWEEAADQYQKIIALDARHRRALDALYKNGVYHEAELRVRFQWDEEHGRGSSTRQRYPGDPPGRVRPTRTDLVDIETFKMVETLKKEIARRTDLSLIETQMWHQFESFHKGSLAEYQQALRLDHQFNLRTYGHVTAGQTVISGTDEEKRFIGDFELTHKALDNLTISLGGKREPYRRNWTTVKEGIDESKLYVRLAGDINPRLDWYFQYGHSWLDKGEWWVNNRTCLVNKKNAFDEFMWGTNYRLSMFPKILQIEYHGIGWMYDHPAATYWAPDPFYIHLFHQGWRHYLNNDQYFEQKQFYYEAGITEAVDSGGAGGIGYNLGLGWDLCHHFGFEVYWSSSSSPVYDAGVFYVQLVARF